MSTSFWGKLKSVNAQISDINILFYIPRCSDFDDSNAASKLTLDFSKNGQQNSSSASLASPSTPTSNYFIDITRGLTLTTVPGFPQKASDLPKLSNYNSIPSIGDYFEVRVTMSANPSNFTVRFCSCNVSYSKL